VVALFLMPTLTVMVSRIATMPARTMVARRLHLAFVVVANPKLIATVMALPTVSISVTLILSSLPLAPVVVTILKWTPTVMV